MPKHISDAARTLRAHLIRTDRIIVVMHGGHVWLTDSYVALRADALRVTALTADLAEGTYSLTVSKGLSPVETFPPDGVRRFLDGMADVDGWVAATPTKWAYEDAALLESDDGPVWANRDLVSAWQETSRALDLALTWSRQPGEGGALRPLRLEAATSPRAYHLNGRKDERRRETVAYVMPVRVESPELPRLDGPTAVPATSR